MLTDLIRLTSETSILTSPEDILSSSLGVIFPDDITNQHGSPSSSVMYLSPRFGEITLTLADAEEEDSRRLFSNFLWNAGVQLGVLIEEEGGGDEERGEGVDMSRDGTVEFESRQFGGGINWTIQEEHVLELGAGTGLAGILAALKGASRVVISDYPAPEVLANIEANVQRNIRARPQNQVTADVHIQGHEWGFLSDPFSLSNKETFGRILVADCLWMPWQHGNLQDSIGWFLKPGGRAWVVAGLHTGRETMSRFFAVEGLKRRGLEVERIWEREAVGLERKWAVDRGKENVTERKRWLVIAVLKRVVSDRDGVGSKQHEGLRGAVHGEDFEMQY